MIAQQKCIIRFDKYEKYSRNRKAQTAFIFPKVDFLK
jgi:hypothetical protein